MFLVIGQDEHSIVFVGECRDEIGCFVDCVEWVSVGINVGGIVADVGD